MEPMFFLDVGSGEIKGYGASKIMRRDSLLSACVLKVEKMSQNYQPILFISLLIILVTRSHLRVVKESELAKKKFIFFQLN